MQMQLRNLAFDDLENLHQRNPGEMHMPHIQAYARRIEVPDAQDVHQVPRRRHLVPQILEQQLHAERSSKSLQMFDRRDGMLQCVVRPVVAIQSEVKDAGAHRHLLRSFECALHLLHRFNASRLLHRNKIQRRRSMPREMSVRGHWRMQRRPHVIRAKPGCRVPQHLPVGVVEVKACGK